LDRPTEWRVLLNGFDVPFKEDLDAHMDWSGVHRHIWTYGEHFEGIVVHDDCIIV
jgi:hypothetical protein